MQTSYSHCHSYGDTSGLFPHARHAGASADFAEAVEGLNRANAELQRAVSKLGHRHAIAVGPAVRASGKFVGFVRR